MIAFYFSSICQGVDRTLAVTYFFKSLTLSSREFRTSHIEILQVETGEPSFQTRQLKLSLQYNMNLKANTDNLAYSCTANPVLLPMFRSNPYLQRFYQITMSSGGRGRPLEYSPWLLQQPNIFFNLSDLRKRDTCPLVLQSILLELFF